MKIYTKIVCLLVWCALLVGSAQAQQKRSAAQEQLLKAQYGENFEEILDKHGDDPVSLMRFQKNVYDAATRPTDADAFTSIFGADLDDIGRSEVEPNNFFDTADNINDVLALPGRTAEYNGKLIQATLEPGDVDVYRFTADVNKMYYFASTHSFGADGGDNLGVRMRLFHESDLDTMLVVADRGIEGNDKIAGDILGRNTDGRNGSDDFRLTGWTPPIDDATGEKLEGDYYLWVFNELDEAGSYFMTAYNIDFNPWVTRAEPNADIVEALTNGSTLPADGVVRTFMAFAPDTIKVVTPEVPVQSNTQFPLLLAQGDEDVDLFLIDYKAGHTLTVETLPYFGWYRENDGTIGPGGSRLTDPRIRIYDADFTTILAEDDDAGRERMDGPNNIHSRLVLDSDFFAANGITEDGPVWLWVSAWASSTRTRTDPGDGGTRSVDNRDPGRFMYDIYATLVPEGNAEVEPNNSVAEATQATAGSQTVISGSFSGAADEDYYRVFMHEVRMYTLFAEGASDIGVEIYREEELDWDGSSFDALSVTGDLLAGTDLVADGDNGFVISGFVPEETGAYIIKLTSDAAGDYDLGLLDKGEIYFGRITNEPDDVAGDALTQEEMEVGPGAQAETAMIFPAGDLDHYYFNVEDGFELSLSLSGTSGDLVDDFDVTMTLFDSDFNEIASDPAAIAQTLSSGLYVVQVAASNPDGVGFYTLSGGLPFEETEPNESFADANAIALGNIYNANLTAGDVDFYEFELEAGKLYSFRSLDNNTGSSLTVEFFDQVNGTTLLDDSDWFNNYSGDNFKIANIIPRETATYYLSVSGGAGDYKITSRVNDDYLALQSKGEPNNSAADADAMGNFQSFGADIMYALADPNHPRFFGDEDWFRVEMQAGQTLNAETKPVGGDNWSRDTDTRLVIFAADGTTELANDDDGGNDWYSSAGYIASADEVVYVVVRTSRTPESADDRSLNRGDYLLNVTVTQAELEPNNTFAEASPLVSGLIQASYAVDDSVDVYSLQLEEDNIYHVRTVRPEGGYDGSFNAMLFKASDTTTNLLSEDETGYNTRYGSGNLKLNIIPDETAEYLLYLSGDAVDGMYYVGVKSNDISELKSLGEPNNSIEEADAIGAIEPNTPGEVYTFMLFNADFPFDPATDQISTQFGDDLDYYKVELNSGDVMVAETSPVDGPLWPRDTDMFMELYDVAGEQIATNDDGGFDWHSRIEYEAENAGPVYVLVRSQDFEGSNDRDPSRAEYNLAITVNDGSDIVITNTEDLETPEKFELSQNYPNPFNPSTTIAYAIPQSADVELAVYNILGQRVATLVNGFQVSGSYQVNFDASQLASGTYLYRIKAGDHVSVKRMVLVK